MGVYFNIMCPNSSIYSDEKSRVLVDKTKSGKVRPWREKKIANVDYFELLYKRQSKNVQKWEFKNVQFYSFNTSFNR